MLASPPPSNQKSTTLFHLPPMTLIVVSTRHPLRAGFFIAFF